MRVIVVDVENSTTRNLKKIDMGPYNPNNFLVSVGYCVIQDGIPEDIQYFFYRHNDLDIDKAEIADLKSDFQQELNKADIFIGHNVKHDAQWLLETDHRLPKKYYDTKNGEYVLLRGIKKPLSLKAIAERYKLTEKKTDLTEEYLANNIGFEAIPWHVVEEYGRGDIQTTVELYLTQLELFQIPANQKLVSILDLMNEFCYVLTDMERTGIVIDRYALEQVKEQYLKEQAELKDTIRELVHQCMGDRPFNLASPEQLSQIIYSRAVRDKEKWKQIFNIGKGEDGRDLQRPKIKVDNFKTLIKENTDILYKTIAKQCETCEGSGVTVKTKKNGDPYSKGNKCKTCSGVGVIYINTNQVAGLKFMPQSSEDASDGGFSTGKEELKYLASMAEYNKKPESASLLKKMMRLNAVDSYLSSFVGGIERNVQDNDILHCKFNQTITSTGRLSSSEPNFHNQPRGKTFPIRKVVVSRFEGGSIIEADYKQLEFRVAAELSGDTVALQDISDGIDVHQRTADVLTEAGQPTDRQNAKSRTFKPLFGGTSGTPSEVIYYKWFFDRYYQIRGWNIDLMNEAINYKRVRIVSGREYAFPHVKRAWDGLASYPYRTQIVNYPVQGHATGDIVPLACIILHRNMKQLQMKSQFINTVHDSIVIDCFPGEEQKV
jgi:DNA polymerase I-like protein with 3'-5' exonuclease and polymerase domains